MREEIEWAISLTRLKQEDKQRLLNIHRDLFGNSIDPCMNCPDEVRQTVNRIKLYHGKQYKREA